MAYRILLELVIFSLPFIAFGLYRLAVSDAESQGRKAWPITALFITGFVMAAALWTWFILREERGQNICYEAARFENGVLIPPREYECEKDIGSIGIPRSEDPGGEAEGVGADGSISKDVTP